MSHPELTLANPPDAFADNTLVSFRAMVQDTSTQPLIYRPQGVHADLEECTVVWAVSVPGEAPWCTKDHPDPTQKSARPHKFPVPGAPHISAQVKIYDSCLAQGIKVSDICTFVGTLFKEPLHTGDLDEHEEPTGSIPTLHVANTYKTFPTIIPSSFPAALTPDARHVREELVTWMAEQALGGDRDAAEWILLSAISKTQSKTPPIYPPSLTLSSFPSPNTPTLTTPTLQHILALILPLFSVLPLTLDTLNTTSFYPESKNEDLHSGWLQVPKGSVYLLTENGITEGKVLDKGIQNLRAVQTMMSAQTLDYVFPFSRFSFPTDVSFVVLTEGKKSTFFQTSVNVPLKRAEGRDDDLYKPLDQIEMPSQDTLSQWRDLVSGSKIGNVTISDETSEYIQEDFVKERRDTAKTGSDEKMEPTVTPDDLAHRMVTARLLALSYHETFLTKEIWEEAKALEARRKARV